jgi:MraZ protein
MEINPQIEQTPLRQPQGSFPGKLDDKGRLKLAAKVEAYFKSLPDQQFFVTSVNRRTARIYPISMWMKSLEDLKKVEGKTREVKMYRETAQRLGSEAEIDSAGRLQFSPELRRGLFLEGKGLHLIPVEGWYEVVTEDTAAVNDAEMTTRGAEIEEEVENALSKLQ